MGRYENMEYIYLDWNVIKYMMCPRKDEHQRVDVYFFTMLRMRNFLFLKTK